MELKLASGLESLVEDFGIPGIAAVVLLPVLVPVATSVAKPLAKAAIANCQHVGISLIYVFEGESK